MNGLNYRERSTHRLTSPAYTKTATTTVPYMSAASVVSDSAIRLHPNGAIREVPGLPVAPEKILLLTDDLAAPIRVDLSNEDGLVILVDPATGIFGAGESSADAVRDLSAALIGHRDVLQSQANLSAELQRQLHVLNAYLAGSAELD